LTANDRGEITTHLACLLSANNGLPSTSNYQARRGHLSGLRWSTKHLRWSTKRVISRHRHGRRPLRAISGRIRCENRWLHLWAKAHLLVQSCNAIGLQCLDDAIEDQTDTHCRDEEANNPGDGINPPRTQWRATS